MNKIIITLIFSITLLNSCNKPETKKQKSISKTQVNIAKITKGSLPDYIELSGKTIYLNKSNITAPISGYITNVTVEQGDKIKKGQLLFEMQSPEAYILSKKDSSITNYGIVKLYAPATGQLVSLNVVNKNVFVDKAAIMCNILASNDLKLMVNVPFEYNKFTKIGSKCKVILPDNTEITGTFSKILPQIDEKSQTIKALANLQTNKFIPENMIVKVLINKSKKHITQILPKTCLQTDALMKNFWVMKIINDSMAIQVNVKTGNQTHDKVEILTPQFNKNDLFINEGAYGLSDTVLIKIN